MSFDTEASLFPSFTRAMTLLSVGTIVECLVGRVAFSNGCKKRPVCCFRVMVALLSSHKLPFRCLDCFETWVTPADVCCASEHKDEIPKPSYGYAIRKHKPPCVSHGIIKVQKVTSQVLFSWNATASAHPPDQPASRPSSFTSAAPNMLPLTWPAAGSSVCSRRITKSHSSPVHVNEKQAPLWQSKASLSADSYRLPPPS